MTGYVFAHQYDESRPGMQLPQPGRVPAIREIPLPAGISLEEALVCVKDLARREYGAESAWWKRYPEDQAEPSPDQAIVYSLMYGEGSPRTGTVRGIQVHWVRN
jgi:hypothetical protein